MKSHQTRLLPARTPAMVAALLAFAQILCAADNQRVDLAPKFAAGQIMVYEVEDRTNTTGKVVGPIDNPETPSQSSLAINLRVRLEVLDVTSSPGGPESLRLRATWEKSSAQAGSDAVNPAAPDPAKQFSQLEGQSLEFSLASNGAISRLHGLEDIVPGGAPPAAAVMWIASLVGASGLPSNGVAPGQQWTSERPVQGVPLDGIFWQTRSTYLRNELCKPLAGISSPADILPGSSKLSSQCAAILSRLAIVRHRSSHSDATPPDYLRNGLRTSGNWTGSGQGLGSISLANGLLVSVTQSSTQSYDYEIKSAANGSSIHYTGKVDSEATITLVSLATAGK